jgi:hypothetical protein
VGCVGSVLDLLLCLPNCHATLSARDLTMTPPLCYQARPRKLEDFADCETDGHYLCSECCHRVSAPAWGEVEA